jgi:alpha-galactosidase
LATCRPKIVLIGAGSASFGLGVLRDVVQSPELRGSTLALVDINEEAVATIADLAQRLSDAAGAELVIEHTTERRDALRDARFVVVAIERERERLWRLDFDVPNTYGIRQVTGENGGPGGLFHSLRMIPPVLAIARDMEQICPEALLINYTNPMSRICLALSRHTTLQFVGLCHGIHNHVPRLARIMDMDAADIEPKAAGINHITWILDLRRKSTGEDLYPRLRETCRSYDPTYLPLDRYLFERYGLFPSPSDDHPAEYLPYAWEFCGLRGPDLEGGASYRDNLWARIHRILAGEEPVAGLLTKRSGERAVDIMVSVVTARNGYEWAVNIPNRGHIANLPDGCIVEVPAVVSSWGTRGLNVGALPDGIAALLRTQVAVQELVVEAAVTGDRQIALQALLADPVVQSAKAAEQTLDELLRLEADYLPQFA